MGRIEDWLLATIFHPRSYSTKSMTDQDHEMGNSYPAAWQDDENWIEDRYTRDTFHGRGHIGHWTGDARAPTYVHPLGADLSRPPPPFRGFANRPGSLERSGAGAKPQHLTVPPASNAEATGIATNPTGADETAHTTLGMRRGILRGITMTETFSTATVTARGSARTAGAHRKLATIEHVTGSKLVNGTDTTTPFASRRHHTFFPHRTPGSAPRSHDGHPLATRTIERRAAGDLHGDNTPDPEYVARELDRLARDRAKDKKKAAPQAPPTADSRLGLWQMLQISDIAQAINLEEWLAAG
ncbi:hypothetical protein C8R43DRAFT_1120814 [Mycena crocata]|nr:hypothetical protein C8R43DRAFT_1120814 [Mycena crocata]